MSDEPVLYVVDDDAPMRAALLRLFNASGVAAVIRGSAEELLDSAPYASRGAFLLDVHMPGLSGIELARVLKDRGVALPVVFLTGVGDVPMAVDLALPAWGTAPLRLGLSVCYDLRFPELYRALMRPPCDVIAVPSAFTHTTGLAHWEVLLRARAIENQCYVLAAAQGGVHENGRRTFGHSLIVDPWGEVLACREEGAGVVLAEIDPARLAQVRGQLPALQHRRIDGTAVAGR